jgi:hypothetical protein
MHVNASYRTLRRLLGQLGLLLPFILLVGNELVIKRSISHYYYSQVGIIFTGILTAFGLFLFTYRGHDKDPEKKEWFSDNLLTNIAGVLAVVTALVPTALGQECNACYTETLCHNSCWWGTIHLVSAAGFLVIMGGIAIFKFTLGPNTGANLWRHPVYRIAGYTVWLSLAAIACYMYLDSNNNAPFANGVFYGETIALVAFGIAWLIKGKVKEMMVVQMVKKITKKNGNKNILVARESRD